MVTIQDIFASLMAILSFMLHSMTFLLAYMAAIKSYITCFITSSIWNLYPILQILYLTFNIMRLAF